MTTAPTTSTTPSASGVLGSITPALLAWLATRVTAAAGHDTVTTLAPYTLEPLATLPVSSPKVVTEAFLTAREAQRAWAARPARDRAAVLLRFHDLVLDRQDAALDLMQAENGKTRRDAFLEITDIAATARYYARKGPSLLKPRRRRGTIPGLTRTRELHHPKGVIAVISPWNYPLSMAAGDTIAALMAGNAVVQKPDTQTALTALWAHELLAEAGLPAGVWQLVVGSGSSIGPALMAGADYVMFTGSTATGRSIARDAGERLIGASLELGGKNPMLVLADADLDQAVEGAIRACFPSAGQLCVSIERLYVHDSLYDEFTTRFAARTRELTLGAGFDYGYDVGSLTNPAQLSTVTAHVDDAVATGATVLVGGRARPDLGPLFYEPTILTGVTSDAVCYRAETFGPLVSVYPYSTDEEAIALANDTEYGLNASVWTTSPRHGRQVAAQIHAGTVNINEAFAAAWGSLDAPMGGMGDSGLGRRHGADGLLKYTEAQTIAHQRLHPIAPARGMDHDTFAKAITTGLRLLKRTRLR
ncbi:succinic semialdehyde dehydrogenase [Streptomyces antibioticus]|uniref:succinic semialdehyde dehydrogenase n=1 Tax=Streptomyces antibioticus TaxID=1890 RepID=UPI00367E1642